MGNEDLDGNWECLSDPLFAVLDKMRARKVSKEEEEEEEEEELILELAEEPLAVRWVDKMTGTSTPPIRRRFALSFDWSCCLASSQADLASSLALTSSSRRLSDAGNP